MKKIKHIAIYCVTYFSYEVLEKYLKSIDDSNEQSQVELEVFVADNTDKQPQPVNYRPLHYQLEVEGIYKNLGYFQAIKYLMLKHSPDKYDYAIISNVDVVIAKNFFHLLTDMETNCHIGWIAPKIYSSVEKRDKNPQVLQRYTAKKLRMLKSLFQHPWLYNLYTQTLYKRKKLFTHQAGKIYAGHGSFIILTKEYFKRCGIINYPIFLFGEELYLAENCLHQQLDVVYKPTLAVYDSEHVSTGSLKSKQHCQYNHEALSYILAQYYK